MSFVDNLIALGVIAALGGLVVLRMSKKNPEMIPKFKAWLADKKEKSIKQKIEEKQVIPHKSELI